MADTLCGAITEKFLATPLLVSLVPSGIWLDYVPEDKDLPWVVLRHFGESPYYTFNPPYYEEGRVDLECYAVWAAPAEDVATAVKDVFDHRSAGPLPFYLDNGNLMSWFRTFYRVRYSGRKNAAGDLVYRATITYQSRIERALQG